LNADLQLMLKNIRTFLNDADLDSGEEARAALIATLAAISVECRRSGAFFAVVDRMVAGAGHRGFRERLGRCKTVTDGGRPGTEDGS